MFACVYPPVNGFRNHARVPGDYVILLLDQKYVMLKILLHY